MKQPEYMSDSPPPLPPKNSTLRSSLTIKIILIGVLTAGLLILTIPLFVVINDRENRRDEVVDEISSKWGRDQTILGPILSVPFYQTVNLRSNTGRTSTSRKIEYLHFLPDELEINATVEPEMKYRGIFETVVYKSIIRISGSFDSLDWGIASVDENEILKDKASLCIGIPDVRGIREATSISFLNQRLETQPGLPTQELLSSGISSKVNLNEENGTMEFVIDIPLDGSSACLFAAGETAVSKCSLHGHRQVLMGLFFLLKKKLNLKVFLHPGKSCI